MNDKLATIALDMLTKVNVPADDNSLAAAQAVRNMLRGIATGQLLVTAKPPMPEPGEIVPK
jgi:hypothetical protein